MAARFTAAELDQDAADAICEQLVTGVPGGDGKPASLRAILRAAGPELPDKRTVTRWLHAFPAFRAQYVAAREEQAEAIFDECIDVSDDRSDDAQSRRVRVDTRKWALGIMVPKRFGARVAVTGPDGGPVELEHAVDLERLDALFDRLKARRASEGEAP